MDYPIPEFPTIRFFIRWGRVLGILSGLGVVGLSVLAISCLNLPLWLILPALFGGVLLYGLFMVLVELLRVVADTLMPR